MQWHNRINRNGFWGKSVPITKHHQLSVSNSIITRWRTSRLRSRLGVLMNSPVKSSLEKQRCSHTWRSILVYFTTRDSLGAGTATTWTLVDCMVKTWDKSEYVFTFDYIDNRWSIFLSSPLSQHNIHFSATIELNWFEFESNSCVRSCQLELNCKQIKLRNLWNLHSQSN